MLIAIDVGGTKVRVSHIRYVTQMPEIVRSWQASTALFRRGSAHFLDDLLNFVDGLRPLDCSGVALTLNGVLSQQRVVFSSVMGGALDVDLSTLLTKKFGVPAFADDDLHATAVAEGRLGEGADGSECVILNLGTGIGAVAFERGRVLRGRFGAGLISEIPYWIEELGEWRVLDRIVCGRGMRELYRDLGGGDVGAHVVFSRFLEGDLVASRVLRIFSGCLCWTIGAIARFYHPLHLVLHGSVAQVWEAIRSDVLSRLTDSVEAEFLPDSIGTSAIQLAPEVGVVIQGWTAGEVHRRYEH